MHLTWKTKQSSHRIDSTQGNLVAQKSLKTWNLLEKLLFFGLKILSTRAIRLKNKWQIKKGKCGWTCNVIVLSSKKNVENKNSIGFSMVALQQVDSQVNKSWT
jgi:hypothetical protein